jgi:hypothetical protein
MKLVKKQSKPEEIYLLQIRKIRGYEAAIAKLWVDVRKGILCLNIFEVRMNNNLRWIKKANEIKNRNYTKMIINEFKNKRNVEYNKINNYVGSNGKADPEISR